VEAAASGQLHVLKWAKEKNLEFPDAWMGKAANSGNLEVIQWVKDNHFSLNHSFSWACMGGHVHVLDWLLENGKNLRNRHSRSYFLNAAEGGHVPVFQWLADHNRIPEVPAEIYGRAAVRGHIEVLRWMKENGYPGIELVCVKGAEGGRLGVVKWGKEEGGLEVDEKVMRKALKGGCLETIEWLYEQVGRPESQYYLRALKSYHLEFSISEIFDFLYKKGCEPRFDGIFWYTATIHGCVGEVIDWVLAKKILGPTCWSAALLQGENAIKLLEVFKREGCPRDPEVDLFLEARAIPVLEWLKREGGFRPRGGPIVEDTTGVCYLSPQVAWWLVEEGYHLTKGVVEEWVSRNEWEALKRAIEEGLEWDVGICREVMERSDKGMRKWVAENWIGKKEW
jgi:hypothetical protein